MTGSRYAPGTEAWGLCKRCHLRFYLHELVFDGYMPGLRVCVDCYDDRQPQEFLIDVTDPIALWKPSPEDGPDPPVLVFELNNGIFLTWTEATPRGGPIVDSYTLFRAFSTDAGVTFSAYVSMGTLPVTYITNLADFVENGGAPYDNEGILTETLNFQDDSVNINTVYRYFVAANFDGGRTANSNIVQAQPINLTFTMPLGSSGDLRAGTFIVCLFFSSRPYPTDQTETMHSAGDFTAGTLIISLIQYTNGLAEGIDSNGDFTAGTLTSNLLTYTNGVIEKIGSAGDFTAGTIVLALLQYTNGLPEAIGSSGDFKAGTILFALDQYTNGLPERIGSSGDFKAGTLV